MNRLVEHLISYLLDEAVFPVQQLDKAERVLGLSKEDIVNTVEQFDPTPTKDYSVWILKQWMFKNIILPEDGHRVLTTLTHYDQNKRKARSNLERDISRYRTIHDLEIALEEEVPALKTTAVEVGHKVKDLPGVTVVKRVPPDLVVLKVEDPDSLATLGEGTKWCTRRSYSNCQAERYIKDYGRIYVVLKQGKPFVQYTPDYEQVKDVDNEHFDDPVTLRQNLVPPEEHTARAIYRYSKLINQRYLPGEQVVAEDPDIAIRYAKLFFVGKRWPEAEPFIAKDAYWSLEYARFLNDRFPAGEETILKRKDVGLMVRYAKEVIGGRWPEAEPFIAKDAYWSLEYARFLNDRFPAGEKTILKRKSVGLMVNYAEEVIKGRWPEAEPFIAKSEDWSLEYARFLKDRFPAGEEAILKSNNPFYIIGYAKDVIGDRWPEAEPYIAKSAEWSLEYARNLGSRFPAGEKTILKRKNVGLMVNYAKEVIKDRWLKAEPYIAKSAEWSLEYARKVNSRFPAGEETILNSGKPYLMVQYARHVIGNRWPEAEPYIAEDAHFSYRYATEVIKGRFVEGEPAIKRQPYLWDSYQEYLASISSG